MRPTLRIAPLLAALACAGGDDTDTDPPTTIDVCDATDAFPTTVAWRAVALPDACRGPSPETPVDPPVVVTSAEDFATALRCDEAVDPGVDFGAERVVLAIFPENQDAVPLGAHRDGDRVRVQLAAPRYCGGAPPPDTAVLVALPADEAAVYVDACVYGACDGPPRP